MGRDKAKKKRAAPTSSSSSTAWESFNKYSQNRAESDARMEVFVEKESTEHAARSVGKLGLQEKQVQIQNEHLALQKELIQLQKADIEQRVMNVDIDRMAP